MLFDSTVFKVIWTGTACLALAVGPTLVGLAVANVAAMVQAVRKAEPKQRAGVLAGYLRQGRHNQRPGHSAPQEPANQEPVGEPPPKSAMAGRNDQ